MLNLLKIFNANKVLPENWLIYSVHAGAYYESDGYRDTWRDHIVIGPSGEEICKIPDRESLIDTRGKTTGAGHDFILSEEGLFYEIFEGINIQLQKEFLLVSSTRNLQKAVALVSRAFNERLDKADKPYIGHLIRVMLKGRNDREKITGVLHDLVEDCDQAYIEEFRNGFDYEIIEAVQSLTKTADEDYDQYLRRVKNNPIGRNVKLYDLQDNMDLSRILNPGEEDLKRIKKYEKAYRFLTT